MTINPILLAILTLLSLYAIWGILNEEYSQWTIRRWKKEQEIIERARLNIIYNEKISGLLNTDQCLSIRDHVDYLYSKLGKKGVDNG